MDEYERKKLLGELREWKRQYAHRLGTNQQYLIAFSHDETSTWQTSTIREHIALITKAAQNHINYKNSRDPQTHMTSFLTTTRNTA